MAQKKGIIAEFKEFLTAGDLMSIAVAFIMAGAIKDLIASFIKDIFSGLISLFLPGKPCIDGVTGKPLEPAKTCAADFSSYKVKSVFYGNFVNAIISFVVLSFVVFMLVKAYKKATGRGLAQDGPTDNDLLKEIRDSLKR